MLDIFATQSDPDSGERLLNAFLRTTQGKGAEAQILGRSGLVEAYDLGGEVRALVVHKGGLYAIANGALWLLSGGTATSKGNLPDGVTRVAAGSSQIAITVSGLYYVYNSTGGTLALTTPGTMTNVVDVAHISGYFVLFGSNAGRDDGYIFSALDDATDFDALDFAFLEAEEDSVVGCAVDHLTLWAFGSRTVEKLYVSSSGGFAPDQSAMIEHGCRDKRTIAKADNRVFWVDEENSVQVGSGAESLVVSPRWVEDVLRASTILNAFVMRDRSHLLYVLVLQGKPALAYDITTGLWHERSAGVEQDAWTATCRENFEHAEYLGTTGGKVCTLSETTYTDDGTAFEFEATSAPLVFPYRAVVNKFQVITSGGSEDIGRTPQIMLQIAKSAAKNSPVWGEEKWANLPNIGQHGKKAVWRRLGQSYFWQARLRITDEVCRDIRGAAYE